MFPVGRRDVGPIALDGTTVIYAFADPGSTDWTHVGVADTQTGTERVVADSAWPDGLINWVAGAGDWIAWVDQSARQSDAQPFVLWAVHAQNMATGEEVILATNGDLPDPFVPVVHGQDGYAFWTEAEPDRTAREMIWKPGWDKPRTLLQHAEMTPGSETATDGMLVFLSHPATAHRGRTVGGDCWAVPLDGSGSPRPLTHTALAMGCAASDGWLAWSLHIDPKNRPLPPDGVLDKPYEVFVRRLNGKALLLHRGYLSTGYPDVGDGFVAWTSGADRPPFAQQRARGM